MEIPLKPHSRNLREHAPETLPANYRDAWFVAHQPTTFAIWTKHWTAVIPSGPRRPPSTSPSLLRTTPSWSSPMHSNRIHLLSALSKQYIHQIETNLKFFIYDHFNLQVSLLNCQRPPWHQLCTFRKFARTPPPPSTNLIQTLASFKPAKLDTPNWTVWLVISTIGCHNPEQILPDKSLQHSESRTHTPGHPAGLRLALAYEGGPPLPMRFPPKRLRGAGAPIGGGSLKTTSACISLPQARHSGVPRGAVVLFPPLGDQGRALPPLENTKLKGNYV